MLSEKNLVDIRRCTYADVWDCYYIEITSKAVRNRKLTKYHFSLVTFSFAQALWNFALSSAVRQWCNMEDFDGNMNVIFECDNDVYSDEFIILQRTPVLRCDVVDLYLLVKRVLWNVYGYYKSDPTKSPAILSVHYKVCNSMQLKCRFS